MTSDKCPSRKRSPAELALAIESDPVRSAEAIQHYEALLAAMNASHVGGEQDALCVFEAVAMLTGQMIANLDKAGRQGAMAYIVDRAHHYAPAFLQAAAAAPHLVVADVRDAVDPSLAGSWAGSA